MQYWINWSKWWNFTYFLNFCQFILIHKNMSIFEIWNFARQRSQSLESQRILCYLTVRSFILMVLDNTIGTSSVRLSPRHSCIDLNPSLVVSKLGSPSPNVKIAPADGTVVPFPRYIFWKENMPNVFLHLM